MKKQVFFISFIFMIILASFIFILIFNWKNANAVSDGTSFANSARCTDSDGGIFVNLYGAVRYSPGSGVRNQEDSCVNSTVLSLIPRKALTIFTESRVCS